MRHASRPLVGVLVTMLATVLALGVFAGPASAAGGPTGWSAVDRPAVVGFAVAGPAAPPTITPGPGPSIDQQIHNADAAVAQRKFVTGVVAVILLVVVFVGRRIRKRHRVKLQDLQNAKG